jgi:hypothetical protein
MIFLLFGLVKAQTEPSSSALDQFVPMSMEQSPQA